MKGFIFGRKNFPITPLIFVGRLSVGRQVGQSVIISLKKLHFHTPIRALVFLLLTQKTYRRDV